MMTDALVEEVLLQTRRQAKKMTNNAPPAP